MSTNPPLSFAAQLLRARVSTAVAIAVFSICTAFLVYSAATTFSMVVLAASLAAAWLGLSVLPVIWRLFARQRPLADQCEELRTIARAIPPGAARMWERRDFGRVLLAVPEPDGRVSFDLAEIGDLDALDRVQPGDRADLVTTRVQVLGKMPVVWQYTSVESDVVGGEDESGQASASGRGPGRIRAFKMLRMNDKTGLLTPTPADLEQLLEFMATADEVRTRTATDL